MEATATISKTSCVNCGSLPFLKGDKNFEIRTQSPILKMSFLNSLIGVLYRMDKKSEFPTFFGIKSIEQFLREFSVVTN